MYTHTHTHTHMRMYIHTHIHIYTHTHKYPMQDMCPALKRLWYVRTQPGSGQPSQFSADGPMMVANWTVLTNSHWSSVCMMDVLLKSHRQALVKTTSNALALKLSPICQQKRWTAMLYASCQKNWSIYATSQKGLALVINDMLKQIKEDKLSSSSQLERQDFVCPRNSAWSEYSLMACT